MATASLVPRRKADRRPLQGIVLDRPRAAGHGERPFLALEELFKLRRVFSIERSGDNAAETIVAFNINVVDRIDERRQEERRGSGNATTDHH